MTDFAKFLNLYQSVGVEPIIEKDVDGSASIIITGGDNDKIVGHKGLSTELQFNPEGKFIQQYIYED